MTLDLSLPDQIDELKPNITVIGVGGAGGNAVNNMIRSKLTGVEFMAANTDSQALRLNLADHKIQLGLNISHGLGAGSRPDIGRAGAEEALEEIMAHLEGTHMVFITAGMGGGTGTGAAPVIARAAREHGILTVGVVTKPFHFEGMHRMRTAEAGIEELSNYVDTLIVIPNQNLFRIATEKTTFAAAFQLADDVLHSGVRGVTDLMVKPGLINLDFADIRAVMREMGKAMMGTGEATGERRAVEAAEAAISNPLLDDASMHGARGVLINITGGADMTLFEVDEAANRIRDEVDPEANIIFGATFDENIEGMIRVSVVATGIDNTGTVRASADQKVTAEPTSQPKEAQTANPVALTPEPAQPAPELHPPELAKPASVPPEPNIAATETPAQSADQEEPVKRTGRWSFFGGKEKQKPKAASQTASANFVASTPARPPEDVNEVRRTAIPPLPLTTESPNPQAQQGTAGFSTLLSSKAADTNATAKRQDAAVDETVQILPTQPVNKPQPKPVPGTSQSEDALEIPAFLRRQAR
jgi:cell division protein FtsZ